ncbi:RNA-binding (RRM/RBD/RNP motifs) family protein [Quillaja saponaria]|uniref:RNA-binding (RRM/RBD/RNP motifs) family protein n=1 Tax=Quillaja saponaria TaxID=32244 RepID=A0AAD7VL89_QUISA|nr:RNA-binding (RRM/RBD/RNP motifs) family protein [Quillaja saponaria]
MAISRLLLPKPKLHFHERGLLKSTRWCSSSSSSGNEKSSRQKESEAATGQKSVPVESYEKKHMELHPGVFPETTQVQLGGSWYALKGILTNLKKKFLGNLHQDQITIETSYSADDRTASNVAMKHNGPGNSISGEHKSARWITDEVIDSCDHKEVISTSKNSCTNRKNTNDAVNAAASDFIGLNTDSDKILPSKPESIVKSSAKPSHSNENNSSKGFLSQMTVENHPEDIMNLTDSEVCQMYIKPENSVIRETENVVHRSKTFVDSHFFSESNLVNGASLIKEENHYKEMKQSGLKHENGNGQIEKVSSLALQFLGEDSKISQKDGANKINLVRSGDHQLDNKSEFIRTQKAAFDASMMPPSSNGAEKGTRLLDLFMVSMENRTAEELPSATSSILADDKTSEGSDEISQEDMGVTFGIEGLISCIKDLQKEPSISTSQQSITSRNAEQIGERGSTKRSHNCSSLEEFDGKGTQKMCEGHEFDKASSKSKDTEQLLNRDIAAYEDKMSEPILQVPLLASKKYLNETPVTLSIKGGSTENTVLVRFRAHNVEKDDILCAFKDCGSILKIEEVAAEKGYYFKDVHVHFKTKEGVQKALGKNDLLIKNSDVFVKATSMQDGPNQISIPKLVGDPDVPVMLVKNPFQTVKIKQMTHDISLDQLKPALAFSKSSISRYFVGSSSSIAYMEFETVDAKERVLAKHSISVSGKKLFILRIDSPRTTVVRISNIVAVEMFKKVASICKSYGQVKKIVTRNKGVVDVHFKLAEWPNMLTILNRLNGLKVDGNQLVAQPAPVFPPEILRVLWTRPDERRNLISIRNSIVKILRCP